MTTLRVLMALTLFLVAGEVIAQTSPWHNLHYAIYFTSTDIEHLLADSASRQEVMEYFAPIKAERVYLECSSAGEVNVDMMKRARDFFRSHGLKVSGAMVPTVPGGPMCYNDPKNLAILERRSTAMAEVFDEFILDDWLFTTCTCDKCVAARGTMSWGDYRTKLLLESSEKYIIEPAKKAHPGIRVIIKYPNWYEGHRQNGYDVYGETKEFDAMAVGIETRNRWWHDQHIPIYSGYIFQKWWPSVDPKKWVGSWLDNYDMKGHDNDYVAQVWQAVLAQSPEIILWCAGQLFHTGPSSDVYPHFREMLPEFDRVAGLIKGSSRGVPMYLPYGSTGEYNIFAYLGMAGIPIEPVGAFPETTQTAIFTEHSLRDPKLADEMLGRLRNGRDVFMTWSLFQLLQNTEFKNMLNVTEAWGTVTSASIRTREGWDAQMFNADRAFEFPAIRTTTWPYARDLALVREDDEYGILFEVKYLNGTLYVLNMPDNSYDLLQLPARALNVIRRPFLKELGMQIEGPGGVALYLFGRNQYVLYNMNDEPATVSLTLPGELPDGWRELAHNKLLGVKVVKPERPWEPSAHTVVTMTVQPFELGIIQAP